MEISPLENSLKFILRESGDLESAESIDKLSRIGKIDLQKYKFEGCAVQYCIDAYLGDVCLLIDRERVSRIPRNYTIFDENLNIIYQGPIREFGEHFLITEKRRGDPWKRLGIPIH